MGFPIVMYAGESWTIKEAECWRIDAFELWYWRRLMRVPWNARRSNQSIVKEISPGYSLEGLMLTLKIQHFGHLMWRTQWKRPWGWERLKAGGDGDDRGWDGWMASPTQWTWVWASSGSWWWTGKPGVLHCMRLQRVRHNPVTEQQERHRSPQRMLSPEDTWKLHVHSHIPCSMHLLHLAHPWVIPFNNQIHKMFSWVLWKILGN